MTRTSKDRLKKTASVALPLVAAALRVASDRAADARARRRRTTLSAAFLDPILLGFIGGALTTVFLVRQHTP